MTTLEEQALDKVYAEASKALGNIVREIVRVALHSEREHCASAVEEMIALGKSSQMSEEQIARSETLQSAADAIRGRSKI